MIKRRKKLLLVHPKGEPREKRLISLIQREKTEMLMVTMPTIAAMTPPEYDITIVDEIVDPIPFDEHFDLVGLTGYHNHVKRAEEVANEFRKKGVLVVSGGASVTVGPERWRHFSDVLFIGPAENTWPQFCQDFLKGDYKNEYIETEKMDLTKSPIPDYSYFSDKTMEKFSAAVVITSVGCPNNCEFCAVAATTGKKMIHKPIEKIMKEINQLADMGFPLICLGADHFSGNRRVARELLKTIKDWNKKRRVPVTFVTEIALDVTKDDELMKLAAEAGMSQVFVGIESDNKDCLTEINKNTNIKIDLRQALKRFSEYGITVIGSLMMGFDHDDHTTFERTYKFFMETGAIHLFIWPLHALDGAPIKERLIQEGRYLDWKVTAKDPERVSYMSTVTVVPKNLSIEELQQGLYWVSWRLVQYENVRKRLETFFREYEKSPVKNDLGILKAVMSQKEIRIFIPFAVEILAFTSLKDKLNFFRFLYSARDSSHPQKWSIAMRAFYQTMDYQAKMRFLIPGIEKIPGPPQKNSPVVEVDKKKSLLRKFKLSA